MSASSHLATPRPPAVVVPRVVAVIAAAGAIGAGLSACSPDEHASDAPYTAPSVVTGDQAPPGEGTGVDGHSGKATASLQGRQASPSAPPPSPPSAMR